MYDKLTVNEVFRVTYEETSAAISWFNLPEPGQYIDTEDGRERVTVGDFWSIVDSALREYAHCSVQPSYRAHIENVEDPARYDQLIDAYWRGMDRAIYERFRELKRGGMPCYAWRYRLPGSPYSSDGIYESCERDARAALRSLLKVNRLPNGTELYSVVD